MSVIGDFAGNLFEGGEDLLFGDYQEQSKNLANDSLYAISTPGLSLIPAGKQWSLTRSPELQNTLSGLSSAFRTMSGEYGDLKGLVEPGFGRLTEAGVNAIRDARRSTLGDLRQNLAKRRVLGSSFAADDVARTTAEFQKREDEFRAQTFLQELQAKQQLIGLQYESMAKSFLSSLEQFNLESGLATQLASRVTAVLGQNSQLAATLTADSQANFLSLVGLGAGIYAGMPPSGGGNAAANAGATNGMNAFSTPDWLKG